MTNFTHKKRLLSGAMLLLMAAATGMADVSTTKIPIKGGNTNTSDRPKAPSISYLYMTYDKEAGTCIFELTPSIPHLRVNLTNLTTDVTVAGDVYIDQPSISVTLECGSYRVTCADDNGGFYGANFEIL